MNYINYTIEIYPHGVLIYGWLNSKQLLVLTRAFRRLHKVDRVDCTGIAERYGANFCLTHEKGHKAWMALLCIKP